MRVIGGIAKGRGLKVPREVARPTTDRVRESIFGVLTPVLEEARVLDLFAGSGGLGIEALSRGASGCVFVEQSRGACRVIEENLRNCRLQGGEVRQMEVSRFLRGRGLVFDLIFADPPYSDGLSNPVTELTRVDDWSEWLAEDGYLVVEQEAGDEVLDLAGLEILRTQKYGRSRMTIFQRKD